MTSGEGKVVAVTGTSGNLASWLVNVLLEHGYTVKASVSDLPFALSNYPKDDPKQTPHLLELEGARERLHLFKVKMLKEGSFDALVDGCEGVFHAASPVPMSADDSETELVDPAVKGTLNLLQSCAKFSSVKRVVVSSSIFAVLCNRELQTGSIVDESWSSDPSYCKEHKMWYALKKTLAENAAWKFAKEHGIDMVTINSGLVIGPLLQPAINFSADLIIDLLNGAEPFPNAFFKWVDVRDVAYAHMLAFEIPTASGRYCLVERSAHLAEVVQILRELYPTHRKFPDKVSKDGSMLLLNPDCTVSTEKAAKSLGIEFIPLAQSLKDMVESLKENKFVFM